MRRSEFFFSQDQPLNLTFDVTYDSVTRLMLGRIEGLDDGWAKKVAGFRVSRQSDIGDLDLLSGQELKKPQNRQSDPSLRVAVP